MAKFGQRAELFSSLMGNTSQCTLHTGEFYPEFLNSNVTGYDEPAQREEECYHNNNGVRWEDIIPVCVP